MTQEWIHITLVNGCMPSTPTTRIHKEAVVPQKTMMTKYKIAMKQTQLRIKIQMIGQRSQRVEVAIKIIHKTTHLRILNDFQSINSITHK